MTMTMSRPRLRHAPELQEQNGTVYKEESAVIHIKRRSAPNIRYNGVPVLEENSTVSCDRCISRSSSVPNQKNQNGDRLLKHRPKTRNNSLSSSKLLSSSPNSGTSSYKLPTKEGFDLSAYSNRYKRYIKAEDIKVTGSDVRTLHKSKSADSRLIGSAIELPPSGKQKTKINQSTINLAKALKRNDDAQLLAHGLDALNLQTSEDTWKKEIEDKCFKWMEDLPERFSAMDSLLPSLPSESKNTNDT
ncbi:unnamed protein product [Owenia fusiformis]|uniref:Uncharacterized protein n=1 Tax=Owenia fusiformis TaxID=6347 RepID=A0A8J1XJ39_OWEFU|nr:unnamed protein product [Owenia fusiformis]